MATLLTRGGSTLAIRWRCRVALVDETRRAWFRELRLIEGESPCLLKVKERDCVYVCVSGLSPSAPWKKEKNPHGGVN
jgi:hypothetical protein